jgi:predicted ATPase
LPQAQAIYRHIAGWRIFDIALARARREAFIPEYPEEVPPLAEDASNLSAFLYALWRLRPDDFDAIAELLSDCIGLPEKLLVEHDAERGGQSARYSFREAPFGEARPVPPQSASDGTIRLLAYLALLFGDRSVSLACLEEPDHGLHPRLMLHLADVLRQAVSQAQDDPNEDGFTPQVLVTTHNPEFMDCFDLSEERDYLQVYLAERDELGRTQFIPATSGTFTPWLERYRLGEAVRRRFV